MKKKILLDLDNVICNPGYLTLLNKFLNTNYKIDDFTTYFFDDIIEDEDEKIKLNYFYLQHNLYDEAEMMPNVYEILKKLNDQYDIYICSACISSYLKDKAGKCYMDKYNYLIKTFPFLKPENFIFTNSKNIIKADIQIDDRLSNLRNDIPLKILFTSYHNKEIKEEYLEQLKIIRVDNWKEIEALLSK